MNLHYDQDPISEPIMHCHLRVRRTEVLTTDLVPFLNYINKDI